MRTEDDLRTLFDDTAEAITAEDLPDDLVVVGGIPVLARITPKRRGWAAVLVAPTAIVIILTAYAVVVGHRSGPVIIAGPPAGPTWVSTLNIPAGWELDMRHLLRGGTELIALRAVDDDKSCAAWTGPGDRGSRPAAAARPAEVGGHSALVGRTSDDEVFGSAAWHVRWSPSPDRWADVTCGGDGETVAAGLDFANVLHLGPTDAVLPVSLADLPYGLAANEVEIQGDIYPRGDAPRVMMTLISGLGPTPRPSLDPDEAERTGAKSVDAVVETLGT